MHNYVRVKGPATVEVQVDDTWYDGTLEAWRREGDQWLGFVRYSTAPDSTYLAWVDSSRVRQVDPISGRVDRSATPTSDQP
jgi:hypothetical protein